MKIGDRYFKINIDFVDYRNSNFDSCKTIEDFMNIKFLTVSKVNSKTFRFGESEDLYKEVPKDYFKLDLNYNDIIIKKIATILFKENWYETRRRAVASFKLLPEDSKKLVCIMLNNWSKVKASQVYNETIKSLNLKLNETEDLRNTNSKIIEKYIGGNTNV